MKKSILFLLFAAFTLGVFAQTTKTTTTKEKPVKTVKVTTKKTEPKKVKATEPKKVKKSAKAETTTNATTEKKSTTDCSLRKWSVGAGIGMVDFSGPLTGQHFMPNRYKATLYATVGRYLNRSFDVNANYVYGNVWHPQSVAPTTKDQWDADGTLLLHNGTMHDLSAYLVYKFNNGYILKEDAVFSPFVFAGLGGNRITAIQNEGFKDHFGANLPVGLGFNFKTSELFSIVVDAAYKFNLGGNENFAYKQAGLKGVFHLGNACKNAKKSKKVQDEVKVQDTDGDGVADLTDECPFVAGKVEFFGCPDSDGDGVGDSRDKCPFEKGVKEEQGCPSREVAKADADNDGVADADDTCPNEAGPASNSGCPVKEETTTNSSTSSTSSVTSNALAGTYSVYFSNGLNIASGQTETLQKIANILRQNPNYTVKLLGHTEKGTKAAYDKNMDLSIQRAEKVLSALRLKGVDATRLKVYGYGDTQLKYATPAKNRRVDIEVYSFE